MRENGSVPLRALAIALSLAAYALAVGGWWQRASGAADGQGCVITHAVQDQVILVAGLVCGLALGPVLVARAAALARALLPQAGPARRLVWVRGLAGIVLVLSAASNALWVDPAIGAFLDAHRPLLIEADLILYVMGLLGGAAWQALLDAQGWLGLLVMPAMALMLVGMGFTGSGWC